MEGHRLEIASSGFGILAVHATLSGRRSDSYLSSAFPQFVASSAARQIRT